MLTWAICWLINKMGGADGNVGIMLMIAMILDCIICLNIVSIFN